eukprot:363750-Chlamydomonas_euryale.AAC.5
MGERGKGRIGGRGNRGQSLRPQVRLRGTGRGEKCGGMSGPGGMCLRHGEGGKGDEESCAALAAQPA